MKVKLLKKLRRKARSQIEIYSVTKQDGFTAGMKIGYDKATYHLYMGVFQMGDTEEEVYKKVENIYIHQYLTQRKPKR